MNSASTLRSGRSVSYNLEPIRIIILSTNLIFAVNLAPASQVPVFVNLGLANSSSAPVALHYLLSSFTNATAHVVLWGVALRHMDGFQPA